MTDFQTQFLDHLSSVAQPAEAGKTLESKPRRLLRSSSSTSSSLALTGRNQPMLPAIDWDWAVTASGSITSSQFYLADSIPQSDQNGATYRASSSSFSDNYRLFVNMISDAGFPAQSYLDTARALIAEPTSKPSSQSAPDGWVRVERSGVQRWAPNWIASDTPSSWQQQVASEVSSERQTFSMSIQDGQSLDDIIPSDGDYVQALGNLKNKTKSLTISARAWSKVTLSPGDWFKSGLMSLGQQYVDSPDLFFGDSGMLNARVSAFFVGADVTFSMKAQSALSSEDQQALKDETSVEIMGVATQVDAQNSTLDSETPEVTFKQSNAKPQMVAAEIETYALKA